MSGTIEAMRNRRLGIRVFAALTVVLAAVVVGFHVDAHLSDRNERMVDDFAADYASARAWLDGGDVYAPTEELYDEYFPEREADLLLSDEMRNPHPPFAVLVHGPLAWMSYTTARFGWLLVSFAAFASAGWVLARGFGASPAFAVTAAGWMVILPIVQKDLLFGQSNGLLLLALVAAWARLRGGDAMVAGSLLGAAAAYKLFPALLVVPLWAAGRRRAALWMAGVATFLAAASAGILRADPFEWLAASRLNFEFWGAVPHNLSLAGLPARFWMESPWTDAVDRPALMITATVVIIAGCATVCWLYGRHVGEDALLDAVPWMLLASPIAWDHYLVMALPVALLAWLQQPRLRPVVIVIVGVFVATPMDRSLWPAVPWLPAIALLLLAVLRLPTLYRHLLAPAPHRAAESCEAQPVRS